MTPLRLFSRFFPLLAMLACASPPGRAHAHPQGRHSDYVLDVLDADGRTLPSYHQGAETYVLGSFGQRYVVRVRNQTGRRVEAVVTVDGRDVISGEPGDYKRQRGYVIPAYGQVEIEGFRRSHSKVAAFRFTNPADSYSSRRGTPQHVGVIGVAVFPERVRPIYHARPHPHPHPRRYPLHERRDSYGDEDSSAGVSGRSRTRKGELRKRRAPAAAESAPSSPGEGEALAERSAGRGYGARDNLGTRYGEDRHSHSHDVRFMRASSTHPATIISLRYDDRQGLISRGIDLHPRVPVARHPVHAPNPFPYNRFAPPPR